MSFDGYVYAGLKKEMVTLVAGEQVLAYTEKVVRKYPDGRKETMPDRPVYVSTVRQEVAHHEEIDPQYYKGGLPCHRYIFPDGRVWLEALQEFGTYDGTYSVIFIALKNEKTGRWVPKSLWSSGERSMRIAQMTGMGDDEEVVEGEYWVCGVDDHKVAHEPGGITFRRAVVMGEVALVDGKKKSIDKLHFHSRYCKGQIGPQEYPEFERNPK